MKKPFSENFDLVVEKDVKIPMRDGAEFTRYSHYRADYNTGDKTILTDGGMPSRLLLPVIPVT